MLRAALLTSCLLFTASAMAAEIPLQNPDFEKPVAGKRIPGWSSTQHAGVRAYEISTDTENFAKGKSSVRMLRTTEQAYGLISQQIDVSDLGGKPVELMAALKTEGVGKKGWAMVLTFKNHNAILDQVRVPVAGDTDWKNVVISKVAPPGSNRIEVGFILLDGGTGWADDVRLRSIEAVKPTNDVKSVPTEVDKQNAAPPESVIKAAGTSARAQAGP